MGTFTRTQQEALLLFALACDEENERAKEKKRKRRTEYVNEEHWDRNTAGAYTTVVQALRNVGPDRHYRYFRMTVNSVDDLFSLIEIDITRNINHRWPIPPKMRLVVALRYLGSGDTIEGLADHYKIGRSTLRKIIVDVCEAIVKCLKKVVIAKPTPEEWKAIADRFAAAWQFPYCCGAIDGKHVAISKPPGTGSIYFNYKRYFSIVLMAVADADYRFISVDIGAPGRGHDSGVFAETKLGQELADGSINLPPGEYQLPSSQLKVPYVFVGDEAFPLQPHLLRPYPGAQLGATDERRIFNYRLSRARRVVESAFGILVAKWRILAAKIQASPENAIRITYACVCLHNWLLLRKDRRYVHREQDVPISSVRRVATNNSQNYARDVRAKFMDYFNSEVGAVEWQQDRVNSGVY